MARRSWRVGPDQLHQTLDGRQIPFVSRQQQLNEVADALVMADRGGGTVSLIYGREPTGLPGEMVTSEMLVTWQDRADAKPQYEEPIAFEPTGAVRIFEISDDPDGPGAETLGDLVDEPQEA